MWHQFTTYCACKTHIYLVVISIRANSSGTKAITIIWLARHVCKLSTQWQMMQDKSRQAITANIYASNNKTTQRLPLSRSSECGSRRILCIRITYNLQFNSPSQPGLNANSLSMHTFRGICVIYKGTTSSAALPHTLGCTSI